MSNPISVILRFKKQVLDSTLLAQRYFVLGIAIQKGFRYLLTPLIIHYYGATVYANYALFFSIVQITALLTSLSVPSANIVYWYQYRDKQAYIGSLLILLGSLGGGLSVIAGFVLYFQVPFSVAEMSPVLFVSLCIIFSMIINLNTISFDLLRILFLQRGFLIINILGLVLFVFFLLGGSNLGGGLTLLILIYIVVMSLQTAYAFSMSKLHSLGCFARKRFWAFARKVLRFSVPLLIYALFVLSTQTVNKWIVRAYFDQGVFTQYIVDFEAALAVLLVTLVISTYNFPVICKLLYKEDWSGLWKNSLEHYMLSVGASFFVGITYYFYMTLGGVHLSSNYWVLAVAFTLSNLFSVNSTMIQAQRRSSWLVILVGLSIGLLWLFFIIASKAGLIQWVCWLYVVYFAMIAAISTINVRSTIKADL